jgi:hypothetical protein
VSAYFPSNPTGLANPFMPHVNPALWWFDFITFIATFKFMNWLVAVKT